MKNGINLCRRGCCPTIIKDDNDYLIMDDYGDMIRITGKQSKEFSEMISLTMVE